MEVRATLKPGLKGTKNIFNSMAINWYAQDIGMTSQIINARQP